MSMTRNPPDENRIVAVLAGGQSRRMGCDKAQLVRQGVSWLEHTVGVAQNVASNVLVVGRNRPLGWPFENVYFLDDAVPGTGPMGGLLAALRWAAERGGNRVLPIACDMPQLTTDAVQWLFEAAARRQLRHGLAVRNNGRIEPLFSIYTAACVPLIEQCYTPKEEVTGRLSLHALIQRADFDYITPPSAIIQTLHNVNTPEDLKGLINQLGHESHTS